MKVNELLKEAAQAKPNQSVRGRWTQIYSVFEKLREQGFSVSAAMDWLVQKGAVPEQQRKKAQNAFMQLGVRRRRAAQV